MKRLAPWLVLIALWPADLSAQFQSGYAAPGADGTVNALASYDDGSGEALFAGGTLRLVDGLRVTGLAKWEGSSWSSIGVINDVSVDGTIRAMTVYDDGGGEELYVCGNFTRIDGQPMSGVARWDGTSWSAVGSLSSVFRLAVYDAGGGGGAELYAASGGFLYKWSGASWDVMAIFDAAITSLAAYDDGNGAKLFIGGLFDQSGGQVLSGIASWDGASVEALSGPSGVGVDGRVAALAVYDDGTGEKLFVGGEFDQAGGLGAIDLATWDGTTWGNETSDPPGITVLALEAFDAAGGSRLAISAMPRFPDLVASDTVSSWDGVSFATLSSVPAAGLNGISGDLDRNVYALAVHDDGSGPALYAGGEFRNDGLTATARVAKWSGSQWQGVTRGDLKGVDFDSRISALENLSFGGSPGLFAAGFFFGIGPVGNATVVRYDGTGWSAFRDPAGPLLGRGRVIEVFDSGGGEQVILGGSFARDSAPPIQHVAAWDGSSWSPLLDGEAFDQAASSIHVLNAIDFGLGPQLVIAGLFDEVAGETMNNITLWDGVAFSAMTNGANIGVNGVINAAIVFDDGNGPALYVGGDFTQAGGVASANLARWDGSSWSAVGLEAPNDTVWALEVYDDGSGPALFVGGEFSQVGDLTVRHIAKWDGEAFSTLPGALEVGVESGSDPRVRALAVADVGNGEKLYVAGGFERAGGLPINDLASWDGVMWRAPVGALGLGFTSFAPDILEAFDAGRGLSLFAAGPFSQIYGQLSAGLGEYRIEPMIFEDGFESGDASAWEASP